MTYQFITELVRTYKLTQTQEITLIAFYENDGDQKLTQKSLGITKSSTLRERMSKICEKLSPLAESHNLIGKGSNARLLSILKELDSQNRLRKDENLTQITRKKIYAKIRDICSSIKVLSMRSPIELGEIYTGAKILKEIRSRLYREPRDVPSLADGFQESRLSGVSTVNDYPIGLTQVRSW